MPLRPPNRPYFVLDADDLLAPNTLRMHASNLTRRANEAHGPERKQLLARAQAALNSANEMEQWKANRA